MTAAPGGRHALFVVGETEPPVRHVLSEQGDDDLTFGVECQRASMRNGDDGWGEKSGELRGCRLSARWRELAR